MFHDPNTTWASQIKIEYNSVMYFEYITEFDVL